MHYNVDVSIYIHYCQNSSCGPPYVDAGLKILCVVLGEVIIVDKYSYLINT